MCDGIFLNYHWTISDLSDSKVLSGVRGQDGRGQDVFVGIDVFGRGCFGGGGYNCNMVSNYVWVELMGVVYRHLRL